MEVNQIDFSRAVSETRYSMHGGLFQPNYYDLLIDLTAIQGKDIILPRVYQENVLAPFILFLDKLGEKEFNRLFNDDLTPSDRKIRSLIEEVAEALLQRNYEHTYYRSSFKDLEAFQALITVLYETFSANSICPKIFLNVLAPMAKWGNSHKGPYTWTKRITTRVGIASGIVNLPPEFRTGGLLAWATIAHEVAGHHLLQSDPDIVRELKSSVKEALENKLDEHEWIAVSKSKIIDYWTACTEEMACDILGVLSMGHSFGIGLTGYLKAKGSGRLNSPQPLHSGTTGIKNSLLLYEQNNQNHNDIIFINRLNENVTIKKTDGLFGSKKQNVRYRKIVFPLSRHPHHILRLLISIRTIRKVAENFQHEDLVENKNSIKHIKDEINNELQKSLEIYFYDIDDSKRQAPYPSILNRSISVNLIKTSVKIIVDTVLQTQLPCLNNSTLPNFVNWTQDDELLVFDVRERIKNNASSLEQLAGHKDKSYARHIVAAAVLESVRPAANIELIFNKMKSYLVDEHGRHPVWNPLISK